MAKKKYWLGPGVLSNPKGQSVKPDEEIPAQLLKDIGGDRAKQLQEGSKIGDQPKSAAYVIAAKNTQAALKTSLKETGAAKTENVKLIEEISALRVENERLKGLKEPKSDSKVLKELKTVQKEKDAAIKELEEVKTNFESLKTEHSSLNSKFTKLVKAGGASG